MIKRLVLLILLVGLCSCNHSDSQGDIAKIEKMVEQVRKALAPDKRNLIFRVKVTKQQGVVTIKGVTDLEKLKKQLFITLKNKGYEIVDSLEMLPKPEFKKHLGITRQSVANLRAEPRHSSELVTQTLMGMPLLIFEEKNGFYHVKTPEGYYAWIDAAGMVIMDSAQVNNWLRLPKIIITKDYGKVYQSPVTDTIPVSDFVLNDLFGLVEVQDDYAQVVYPDGRYGYIKNDAFLTLNDFVENYKNSDANTAIKYAKQYLGIPYLWGGTSIKGLDCSGFTKNVYSQLGYLLPRDASQQVKIGKEIKITPDFSNLIPGDLLFFGRTKDGKEKVTHVAFHLGKGRIIHETGEVKIESLNKNDADYNPDRFNTLLHARRITGYLDRVFVKYYTSACPMLEIIQKYK